MPVDNTGVTFWTGCYCPERVERPTRFERVPGVVLATPTRAASLALSTSQPRSLTLVVGGQRVSVVLGLAGQLCRLLVLNLLRFRPNRDRLPFLAAALEVNYAVL